MGAMETIDIIVTAPISGTRLPDGHVDVGNAARALGVTRQTIVRWIVDGVIAAERQDSPGRQGFRYRIPTPEIARLRRERA